ncbi:hypothetical protein AAY473_020197 [Plecturocebus cupreus]
MGPVPGHQQYHLFPLSLQPLIGSFVSPAWPSCHPLRELCENKADIGKSSTGDGDRIPTIHLNPRTQGTNQSEAAIDFNNGLDLLGESSSVSQWQRQSTVAEIETLFCPVGQAGLELLISGDPPALGSQNARITGVSHCTWSGDAFLMSFPDTHFPMLLP